MFEVITRELRAKLLIAHVNPLTRAWAAPPTLSIAGSRTSIHTTTDTESANVQFHSVKPVGCGLFSPNGSALWRPHPLDSQPRHHQTGGIASLELRHAVRAPLMLQNPHRSQPEVCRIAYKSWSQHRLARKDSPSTAPPVALPRKSSPSTRKNAEFGPI